MQDPYHIILKKIFGGPKCGTPFIQMEQMKREEYSRMTAKERAEKEREVKNYQKKENLLNIIRLILLIIIIVGIILLCTQRFWIDNLVTFILRHSKTI